MAIFRKTLNYTKSSGIIICAKISRYSHYTYCPQEESTHFGLRVSTNFSLEVSVDFGPKKYTRKIPNVHRDF